MCAEVTLTGHTKTTHRILEHVLEELGRLEIRPLRKDKSSQQAPRKDKSSQQVEVQIENQETSRSNASIKVLEMRPVQTGHPSILRIAYECSELELRPNNGVKLENCTYDGGMPLECKWNES